MKHFRSYPAIFDTQPAMLCTLNLTATHGPLHILHTRGIGYGATITRYYFLVYGTSSFEKLRFDNPTSRVTDSQHHILHILSSLLFKLLRATTLPFLLYSAKVSKDSTYD